MAARSLHQPRIKYVQADAHAIHDTAQNNAHTTPHTPHAGKLRLLARSQAQGLFRVMRDQNYGRSGRKTFTITKCVTFAEVL